MADNWMEWLRDQEHSRRTDDEPDHWSYPAQTLAELSNRSDRIRALESELAELRKSEAAALEESAVWRRDAVRYEKERDAALHELAELRKHGEGFLVAGACACDLLERILDGEVAAERRVAVAMAAKLRSALAAWVAAAQSPRPEPERRDAMEEVPQRPPVIPCKTQSHRLGKPCARCGWEHPDDAMRRRDDTARLQANAAASVHDWVRVNHQT